MPDITQLLLFSDRTNWRARFLCLHVECLIYLGIPASQLGRKTWCCSLIFSRTLTSCNGKSLGRLTTSEPIESNLVNMLWLNDNIVAAPVSRKCQKCRSACQRVNKDKTKYMIHHFSQRDVSQLKITLNSEGKQIQGTYMRIWFSGNNYTGNNKLGTTHRQNS